MKTKFWVLLTALLSVTLVNYHCRKQDERYTNAVEEKDQSALVHEFLHTNAGTDPLVRSVATEIERREKLHPFVYEFARANGLPVWNKAIVTLPSIKNVQQNASGAGGDSLVYIPLVIPDAGHTNGFIRAVINDSISLSYCLAKDYKNYSFSTTAGITSADEFASLLMMMDKNVFGIKDFTITDQRLLLAPGQTVSAGISRSARITDVVSGTGNNLCEGTLFTVSWLVQDAANCTCANGASNGGVCHDWFNGCADCSNTVTISINVGASGCGGAGGEGPVGGGIPIGGGPSGGGTGSGGGQIPPYYPCVGTVAIPLLQEPLPPCPPPAGGVGWTPMITSVCSEFNPNISNVDPDIYWWNDETTSFPTQPKPSWAAVYANYPKKADGSEMCGEDVYNLIGGNVRAMMPNPPNACALRVSRALNYSGVSIPYIPNHTFQGGDGKYYFLSSAKLYNFLRKTFGNPTLTLTQAQGGANGVNFPNLLAGKKGIYLMQVNIPKLFGALGHASLYIGNSCVPHICDGENHNGCYFNAEGGINKLSLWEL